MLLNLEFEILILLIPALILSLCVHEYSHGITAYYYGDDTAYQKGRLTLNGGGGFSINGKNLSGDATIDLPIAYPRLSIYFNGFLFKLGGEYYRQIN